MKDPNKSSQLAYYKTKSNELERKLNIFRLALETYANPLNKYDDGELAKIALQFSSNRTFKPKRLDGCTFAVRYIEFNLNEDHDEEN